MIARLQNFLMASVIRSSRPAALLQMQTNVQVMVEERGHASGLAATPALLALEESLDVQALSVVRALRHQAYARGCLHVVVV